MRSLRLALATCLLWTLACTASPWTEEPVLTPAEPEPVVDTAVEGAADGLADAEDQADSDTDAVTEAPGTEEAASETPTSRSPRRRRVRRRKPRAGQAKGGGAAPPEGAREGGAAAAPSPEGAPAAGGEEGLSGESDGVSPAEAAEPAPSPAPSSGAEKAPGPKPAGITKTGTRTWTVTKSLFQRWKDDPYKLGHIKEKGEGWEVRMVRQRHAYHLGVRGKDVVLTVNGRKLDTNAQLMSAYVALQFKKKFDVEIVRNGKVRVHHYEVVSD